MSGRVTSCCVALFFLLNSVTAVQKRRSINSLKKIDFGNSVPKHSLVLLYWFANTIDIDDNNIIRLTFNPSSGDYGAHYYHNSEGVLDPLPWGNEYQYYSLGNLYQETSMPLPSYVVRPRRGYEGTNSDRIIIRIRGQNTGWRASQRIDQVYLTQHVENQGEYDPDYTYRITTNLLRQIREFRVGRNHWQLLQLRNLYGSDVEDEELSRIRNTRRNRAGLGLLLLIVIQKRYSYNRQNRRNHSDDDTSESESNVPRYVAVDFKNHGASRTTGNTASGTSAPQSNNNKVSLCCCCMYGCFAICFILVFCIIFLADKRRY